MNEELLNYIRSNPLQSSKEIYNGLGNAYSYATIKRALSKLAGDNLILIEGQGKGTKYRLSPSYELLIDIDIEEYFKQEQDERQVKDIFNLSLIPEVLTGAQLFTAKEEQQLEALQRKFKDNVAHLSKAAYGKEM